MHDNADEYADMNIDVDPEWGTTSSDHGAGNLGFAGTVSKGATQAAGLATLCADDFGVGPTTPMVPGTWSPDTPEGEGDRS
jgi:PPE-repeat protein